MNLYQGKAADYFNACRMDLLNLIPDKCAPNRILEIGAGAGNTLAQAKRMGYANEVVGIDLVDSVAKEVRAHLDRFIVGDVERDRLDLEREHFDVIILGDVIEHLLNPWGTLANLIGYLRSGGAVIASIPNIREKSILLRLVFKGDLEYGNSGILDATHFHFFCRRNMIRLFEGCGLKITKIGSDLDGKKKTIPRVWQNKLTFRLLEEFFVTQYHIVALKP